MSPNQLHHPASGMRRRAVAALVLVGVALAPGASGAAAAPSPSAPAAAGATQILPVGLSPTELYITGVYTDLFGRAPDPTGLQGWTNALNSGTPRIAVANGITYSTEYRSGLITESYNAFLGRAPEAEGLQSWLLAMNAGTTIQHMEAGFIASGEYYAAAGGTSASWVAKMYVDVMGRDASSAEVANWSGAVDTGANRLDIARSFLFSTEHLTRVIQGHYLHLLGRGIDPAGNSGWVTAIQGGARVEQVIGGIVASNEYLYRVTGTTPPPAPPAPPAGTPGPTNTGVPAGTVLTVHDGDLTITTPGAVVSGLDIRGYLRIKAANVTVKNSVVRGRAGLTGPMALIQSSASGVVIQDVEVAAAFPSYYVDGFVGNGATFTRVNIHGVVDSIKLTGGNVTVQDSWLHDNTYYASVPSGGDTHTDNIQIQRGDNITVRNSVLSGTRNAAMMITQDTGDVSNITFTGNHADGGACTINVAEKSYGPIGGLTFTNNTFGLNTRNARCAMLMPTTTSSLSTVTGNSFTDGTVATASRG